jgi:hypothetical protein
MQQYARKLVKTKEAVADENLAAGGAFHTAMAYMHAEGGRPVCITNTHLCGARTAGRGGKQKRQDTTANISLQLPADSSSSSSKTQVSVELEAGGSCCPLPPGPTALCFERQPVTRWRCVALQ